MLHILLLILKILGIILLIILFLFLLGVYSLFFAPVGWKLYTKREETIQVSFRAGWLFRIVTVRYSLDQAKDWEQDISVRFLGIPVTKLFNRKNLRSLWRRRRRRASPPDREPSPAPTEPVGPMEFKPPVSPALEPSDAWKSGSGPPAAEEPEPSVVQEPGSKPEAEEKIYAGSSPGSSFHSLWEAVRSRIRKFCDGVKRIGKALANIKSAFLRMVEKKDKLLEFWRLEEHKSARNTVKKEFRYLWDKSRPRKVKGTVNFGFDDPSYTGLCMGAVGMLCAWYPKKLKIIPDFEQEIFKWDICAKGRFRGYVPTRFLWRLFTDEEIRLMYERWERL